MSIYKSEWEYVDGCELIKARGTRGDTRSINGPHPMQGTDHLVFQEVWESHRVSRHRLDWPYACNLRYPKKKKPEEASADPIGMSDFF